MSFLRVSGRLSVLVPCILLAGGRLQAGPVSGEEIYRTRCAGCHDQVNARIPTREALQKMSASRILRTLDFGLMMSIAYPLRRDEREVVASFLGMAGDDTTIPASAFCPADKRILSNQTPGNWNGWSPSPSNTRYQSAEAAGLTAEQIRKLKLKW